MVVAGISSQADDLTSRLQGAADEIQGWLEDLGVSASSAESAQEDASASVSDGSMCQTRLNSQGCCVPSYHWCVVSGLPVLGDVS